MKTKIILFIIIIFINIIACSDDDSMIDTKPVAAFTASQEEIVPGGNVLFTDVSFDQNGSISTWSWDFGDGTTSSDQSPTKSYEVSGEYEVVLTVTDNTGNINVNEFSKTISVSTANVSPTILWTFPLTEELESASPAVGNDGTIYMACSAKNGVDNMFAISPDGSQIWSYATGDINRSTVSIDDNGNIYVGSYDDNLYSFNPDGSVRFQFDTGSNPRYNGATFGFDGTVYIGSQSNKMFALTPDGNEIWNFEVGGDFNATPAIGIDGTLYVGNTDDNFYAINPDGSEKWSSEYGSWSACATAIGQDGTIYFSGEGNNLDPTSGGVLIAYNPNDGSEIWRVGRSDKVSRGGPVISPDGTLYLVGEDGLLVAYNTADGSVLWTYELNDGSLVTPAIDNDGNIYFGDESGFFYVISPEGERVWSTTKLGTRVWSSVTIGDNGIIYVGADQDDETALLYAIQTEATGPASSGWPMRAKNARHTGR